MERGRDNRVVHKGILAQQCGTRNICAGQCPTTGGLSENLLSFLIFCGIIPPKEGEKYGAIYGIFTGDHRFSVGAADEQS